jgi:hypothetical protein
VAQPAQPATLVQLQVLLDRFADEYNHRRPHRSLPHRATPATIYDSLPKALPPPAVTPTPTIHARTRVIFLVQDHKNHISYAVTGELRDFVIGPSKDYQPTCAPKGPTRPRNPETENSEVPMSREMTNVGLTGFEPATP